MRILLALPALALMFCAAPAANANLVTHSSVFSDANLSAPLPEFGGSGFATNSAILAGSESSFAVVASGSNSVAAGDSVTFTSNGIGFFRGTSSPASVPGFASFVGSGLFATGNAGMSIQFDTVNPVTEIRLSIADLEAAGALLFSSMTTAGAPSLVTGVLNLSGANVTGNSDNAVQGEIVWTFVTPVVDPTIAFDFDPAFSYDQTHFSGLSYTTLAAIPEPMSFVWFASAFGLVQYGRRRRMDAELAD
jgi:hypothetical protein